MIFLYCWNKGQNACLLVNVEMLHTEPDKLRSSSDVLWIDLEAPTPEEEQLVYQKFFPVHPLTLEDITRLRRQPDDGPHFPKAEEFQDYLFVVVNPLAARLVDKPTGKALPAVIEADRATTQLSAVLSEKVLITHHYEPVKGVEELREFMTKHEERVARGPDYLFHLILDNMVDQYAPVLDHFDDALDDLEVRVLEKPTQQVLVRLHRLKRSIIAIRKTLVYEREVLARLARGEFSLIEEREMVYYRNVYDHLVRFTELIESSREMAGDLVQTHLSATSNKLNEIMKVLAMISTVVLPMTLIAGVYGMNFERHLPDVKWYYGFEFALGLMLLTGVGSFVFFRWKKWI